MNAVISLQYARNAMLLAGLLVTATIRADEVFIGGPETADDGSPVLSFDPNVSEFVLCPAPMPLNGGVLLLGFRGDDCGWGVHVRSVNWGSIAQRIGLEPGDVIVGLNGTPIRSLNDYRWALQQSGGVVALEVRDVRTGNLVTTVPTSVIQPVPNGVACAAPDQVY